MLKCRKCDVASSMSPLCCPPEFHNCNHEVLSPHNHDHPFPLPQPQLDQSINFQPLPSSSSDRFCKKMVRSNHFWRVTQFLTPWLTLSWVFSLHYCDRPYLIHQQQFVQFVNSQPCAHPVVTDSVRNGEICIFLKKLHSFLPHD